jgi:hypothetical protein
MLRSRRGECQGLRGSWTREPPDNLARNWIAAIFLAIGADEARKESVTSSSTTVPLTTEVLKPILNAVAAVRLAER